MKIDISFNLAYFVLIIVFTFSACENNKSSTATNAALDKPLFTLLTPQKSGIDFQNRLTEGPNTNILVYEYFYNGGGVVTADFNSDDLVDIYFTANMEVNRLYLNRGNMTFTNVTDIAKVSGRPGPWKTGATLVDINGDNKLDLYLCYSGALPDAKRANQLLVNIGNNVEGVPVFEDQTDQYGLGSTGYSNQAYFFDYDRDDDLDMLLLNHNPKSLPILNEASTAEMIRTDDADRGLRLYRQDKGVFADVTTRTGIIGSGLSYGLGIGIGDFDEDGWPDFYVSNDYAVPDYFYVNNRNGTFRNDLGRCILQNSQFSMGNDVSDVNNDGYTDIFTLDMLPEDNKRQKLLTAPDNYAKFDLNVRTGFHYQYMRNMLQINNGNSTFSEIGQIAGISNSDWSWSALFADFDNDGWKDLSVTNGYLRDYTNLDFINYMDNYVKQKGRLMREDVLQLIEHMPASDVSNYIFKNEGHDVKFTDKSEKWTIKRPSNSNGAAYADLDNDGDLDLVINNINQPAFIYQNDANSISKFNFLDIDLNGNPGNTLGIGTSVSIYVGNKMQMLEQYPTRGYLSAVSPTLHFGLGNSQVIDSLIVVWPSGNIQQLENISTNTTLQLNESEGQKHMSTTLTDDKDLFFEVKSPFLQNITSNSARDFDRQPLLISEFSHESSCLANADVNKDGLEDVFVGGSKDFAANLYIQNKSGRFVLQKIPDFERHKEFHNVDAVFFDANGDSNLDLYLGSGGYHDLSEGGARLLHRLYFNDGKGHFTYRQESLPDLMVSTGSVAVYDINGDGHQDIFVGGRVLPGRYPESPRSYILINDGMGSFADRTADIAPELQHMGMVTDAEWADLDSDSTSELIVTGEWMPILVYAVENGKLVNKTDKYFEKTYNGWWNTLKIVDINGDGAPDIVAGNHGLNSQIQASEDQPVELYFGDFDKNGSVDPILCSFVQGISYPYVSRDELLKQLGHLRDRFNSYELYSEATLKDILTSEELKSAKRLYADHLRTSLIINQGSGKMQEKELPTEVQYAPIYAIADLDYDQDGKMDLIFCGNNQHMKLRLGRMDSNYGILLKGDGGGTMQYIPNHVSGLQLKGEIRQVLQIGNTFYFSRNEDNALSYKLAK